VIIFVLTVYSVALGVLNDLPNLEGKFLCVISRPYKSLECSFSEIDFDFQLRERDFVS